MRQCPTLNGDDRPLIAHCIASNLCAERQRDYYHKCHRCVYRGKPADFVLEPPHQNGVSAAPMAAALDSAAGAARVREQQVEQGQVGEQQAAAES